MPKIDERNQLIKNEIIKQTSQLLGLEELTLSDFVDFSNVLVQKFDNVITKDGCLVLIKDDKEIKLQIKDNLDLIKKIIDGNYGDQKLDFERKQILLEDLKSLPIIDFDKQKGIKGFIDNLVFCLYFNIDIPKDKVSDAKFVNSQCLKNKFYEQLSK